MILIFSSSDDPYANEVCLWLLLYKKNYIRINENDSLKIINYENSNDQFEITFNDKLYLKLSEVKSIWFGRYLKQNLSPFYFFNNKTDQFYLHLVNERNSLYELFLKKLQKKRVLGNFELPNLNKLHVLNIAKEVGLNVPATIVTSSKEELLLFKEKYGRIINKGINETLMLKSKGGYRGSYTNEVNSFDINKLEAHFYYSLFQKLISKRIELRIQLIGNELFTTAIFSQENIKTSIDLRRYDSKTPNRTSRFKLPKDIEKKLLLLFSTLKLNQGSIDMIISDEDEYIFLEINPVGIFGMYSYLSNYYCAKKVANYLINK